MGCICLCSECHFASQETQFILLGGWSVDIIYPLSSGHDCIIAWLGLTNPVLRIQKSDHCLLHLWLFLWWFASSVFKSTLLCRCRHIGCLPLIQYTFSGSDFQLRPTTQLVGGADRWTIPSCYRCFMNCLVILLWMLLFWVIKLPMIHWCPCWRPGQLIFPLIENVACTLMWAVLLITG
jgi:hypothetical protein